jgi:Ca2+-binding EF-hand superfamily protein
VTFNLLSELVDALSQLPQTEKNQFSIHSIRNKSDVPNDQSDRVSFGEMINRIESTLKDTKDSLYLEEYFKLIDADGDGFISHTDLESMTGELGSGCMT